jgi:hypothetical protein
MNAFSATESREKPKMHINALQKLFQKEREALA